VKVIVDFDSCIASGACVTACPEVFAQDEDGIVELLQEEPGSELHGKVNEAIDACPAACISSEG
jgi:ferredoxin